MGARLANTLACGSQNHAFRIASSTKSENDLEGMYGEEKVLYGARLLRGDGYAEIFGNKSPLERSQTAVICFGR